MEGVPDARTSGDGRNVLLGACAAEDDEGDALSGDADVALLAAVAHAACDRFATIASTLDLIERMRELGVMLGVERGSAADMDTPVAVTTERAGALGTGLVVEVAALAFGVAGEGRKAPLDPLSVIEAGAARAIERLACASGEKKLEERAGWLETS